MEERCLFKSDAPASHSPPITLSAWATTRCSGSSSYLAARLLNDHRSRRSRFALPRALRCRLHGKQVEARRQHVTKTPTARSTCKEMIVVLVEQGASAQDARQHSWCLQPKATMHAGQLCTSFHALAPPSLLAWTALPTPIPALLAVTALPPPVPALLAVTALPTPEQ